MATLQLVSYNVNGLLSPTEKDKLEMILETVVKASIVCIQETHNPDQITKNRLERQYRGKVFWNDGDPNDRGSGLATLVDEGLFDSAEHNIVIPGRLSNISINWRSVKIELFNIYIPPQLHQNTTFVPQLVGSVLRRPEADCVYFIGDFNYTDDPKLDRLPRGSQNTRDNSIGTRKVKSFFEGLQLADVWRERNPTESNTFSCYGFNGYGRWSSRIDRLLIAPNSGRFVGDIEYRESTEIGSGHSQLWATLINPAIQRWGKGYWKINNSSLDKRYLRKRVTGFWQHWKHQKLRFIGDSFSWWAEGQSQLRSIIIADCKRSRKEERDAIEELQKQIDTHRKGANLGRQDDLDMVAEIKSRLKLLLQSRVKGHAVRAGIKEISESKGATSWYKQFEVKRGHQTTISSIHPGDDEQNPVVEDPAEIEQIVTNYYEQLYSAPITHRGAQLFLLQHQSSRLTEEQKANLDSPISAEEVYLTLTSMANGKSPGIDGFSKEFYVRFWDVIGVDLTEILNNCLHSGSLPKTMRKAVISLIFKKGNPSLIKNWRPVSLLPVDYKILSGVLMKRLNTVMSSLVDLSQSGGVPDRRAADNLVLIRSLIDYVESRRTQMAIIGIDMDHAFDRVSHSFIHLVLEHMNFGPHIRGLIAGMYREICSTVMLNGKLSRDILVHSGIRQGCPLSMALYVLQLEPLLSRMRKNTRIEGIKPPNSAEIKFVAYVDDTNLLVANGQSFGEAMKDISIYADAAGGKLNADKTEIVRFGQDWTEMRSVGLQPKWIKPHLKILGVHFGQGAHGLNWEDRINKLLAKTQTVVIGNWFERAKYANCYLLSKLWYAAVVDPPSRTELQRIIKITYDFIFGSGFQPIKRGTLARPEYQGGVGLINIEMKLDSMKGSLIAELLQGEDPTKRKLWWGLLTFFSLTTLIRKEQWLKDGRWRFAAPLGMSKDCLEAYKKIIAADNTFELSTARQKQIYQMLQKNTCEKMRIVTKLPDLPWFQIFARVSDKIIPAKLREIHLKLIHSGWNIQARFTRAPCDLCNAHPMTLEHITTACDALSNTRIHLNKVIHDATGLRDHLNDLPRLLQAGAIDRLSKAQQNFVMLVTMLYGKEVFRAIQENRLGAFVDDTNTVRQIEEGLRKITNLWVRLLGRQRLKDGLEIHPWIVVNNDIISVRLVTQPPLV